MSFLTKIWKGVKTVGGAIGKIFKKKETGVILNAAANLANQSNQPAGYYPGYTGEVAPASSGGGWLDWLNGNQPLDINRFVTLPTVQTNVKPVNYLMLFGVGAAIIYLLKGKK